MNAHRTTTRSLALILSLVLVACASASGSAEATPRPGRATRTPTEPFLPPTWTPQEDSYSGSGPSPTFIPITRTVTNTPWPSQTPKPTRTSLPTATKTPAITWTPCPGRCPTRTPAPTAIPGMGNLTGVQIGVTPIATGLNRPVGLAMVPGINTWAVILQSGVVYLVENGTQVEPPLLDISTKVNDVDVEMGLLGIAFHPNAAQNGAMYVDYTDFDGNIIVERYTLRPDRRTADPASASTVIKIRHIGIQHNGGHLAFGPDGMLYISVGDGGGIGGNQMLPGGPGTVLLGSILRIDVNTAPYKVPTNNPFLNTAAPPELWHIGLRNPWRFSFDRRTGDMYIGDVGEGSWEEINYAPSRTGGLNFGWPVYEGPECYGGGTDCPALGLTMPVTHHDHKEGCSVTGGYVYRGKAFPKLDGIYIFSDFCTGVIWGLVRDFNGAWSKQSLMGTGLQITSFAEDTNGEIYFVDYATGRLLQITTP